MSDPRPARPVPGPGPQPVPRGGSPDDPPADTGPDADGPFADLDERPVGEHVAVFEAEHDRLRRELGTIDQL